MRFRVRTYENSILLRKVKRGEGMAPNIAETVASLNAKTGVRVGIGSKWLEAEGQISLCSADT